MNSVLSIEEVRWVWAIYYMAAIGCWLLLAWILNYKRFQGVSLSLLAVSAGMLFTPWFIIDSKPEMAPVFIVLLFDLLSHSGQSIGRLLVPAAFVSLLALLVLMSCVGLWRWKSTQN